MPVTPITPAQTDALAKFAEIPPVGSEERDFWLEAAIQHGFREEAADWGDWVASGDAILTLMSEARKQGQRDVLGATAQATTPDPRVDMHVWSAARSLDAARAEQPEWLWFAKEDSSGIPVARYSFGRWAKLPEQAPYVRADIALGMMSVERFACAARRQGTIGGNDPADCDWPVCGCDPHADKVIAALQESGALATGGARG